MRGITTLTLTINGQPITIRVQVLKNAIPDSKMERIADSIGRQTNYYYGDSRVMCSAYSYAYCYRQIGGSSQHYVTFYDYEDKGDQLSDFKILDPWDGNLTTGAGYGYSYGYHVVTVNS